MSEKESTTDYIILKGPCRWAKVFEHSRDMKGYKDAFVECDGAYTIEMILDEENMDILRGVNSSKEGRLEEDGTTVVKFVRKHNMPNFNNYSGPPRVVHADGVTAWDPDVDADGSIGNDSIVQVGVSIYDAGKNRGSRLNWVQVLEQVEYEAPEGGSGAYSIPAVDVPAPKKPSRKKAASKTSKPKENDKPNADLDDEIPF